MATLKAALPYVLANEGEFSNTAGDAGGETLDGIARRMHPEWPGWAVLDKLGLPLADPRAADIIINANVLAVEPLVESFYLQDYWLYDGLADQAVATKLLDGAVNMEGNGRCGSAIKALQQAICKQLAGAVEVDGCYGPATEAAANRCDAARLLQDLALGYVAHYLAILAAHPEDAAFKSDWLERANKLPQGVTA